jgi:hypothetical protein
MPQIEKYDRLSPISEISINAHMGFIPGKKLDFKK